MGNELESGLVGGSSSIRYIYYTSQSRIASKGKDMYDLPMEGW